MYDFIVVGAGASGSVIARGLSENEQVSVLLIEAGGLPSEFSTIPAMFNYLGASELNWGCSVKPQNDSCLGTLLSCFNSCV